MTRNIDEMIYRKADFDEMGWCQECQDFTTERIEPEDEREHCNTCKSSSVWGAQEALRLGLFLIPESLDSFQQQVEEGFEERWLGTGHY